MIMNKDYHENKADLASLGDRYVNNLHSLHTDKTLQLLKQHIRKYAAIHAYAFYISITPISCFPA
jgi:hypothetical protein